MTSQPPPAEPHGELRKLFDDVYFVTGAITMKAPVKVRFSRNMTVIRDGEDLTLVNTLRLDEAGLAALDALGRVKHVIRIAGFHGVDDPFYKQRYGAKVWTVKGQKWSTGFDNTKADAKTYFEADEEVTEDSELPVAGGRILRIDGNTPEGLLLLERHGGTLVSGDALQNIIAPDTYFNFMGRLSMRLMGFFKPHNVGPGWLKGAKPNLGQLKAVLDHEFENLLPAHGVEVLGGARDAWAPAIRRL